MKNYLVSRVLMTSVFLLTLLILSCKETDKSVTPSASSSNSISIEQSKTLFNKMEAEYISLNGDNGSAFKWRIPVWKAAVQSVENGRPILTVPLVTDKPFQYGWSSTKIIFYEAPNNASLTSMVVDVIDESQHKSNQKSTVFDRDSFEGSIVYSDYINGPLIGYTMKGGKVTSTNYDLKLSYKDSYNVVHEVRYINSASRSARTTGCINVTTNCRYGYNAVPAYGTVYYTGWSCDSWLLCVDAPAGPGITYSGGSGSANRSSSFDPLAPAVIGNVGFLFQNTRPCVGYIVREVVLGTAAMNVATAVLQSSSDSWDVSAFMQSIYNGKTPYQVVIREGDLTPDANGNKPNASTYSQVYTTNDGKLQTLITLDRQYLASATNLSIARTIIHECAHAYMVYGMAGSYGPAFKTSNEYLFQPDGNPVGDQNSAQHIQMLATYVDQIASALYNYVMFEQLNQYIPGSNINQYLKDLSYGGLQGYPAYESTPYSDQSRSTSVIQAELNKRSGKGTGKSDC